MNRDSARDSIAVGVVNVDLTMIVIEKRKVVQVDGSSFRWMPIVVYLSSG
jgi:hypothetical protein